VVKEIAAKRQRRKPGNILAIPATDGSLYFGRELNKGVVACYDLRSDVVVKPELVLGSPVLFSVPVMNYAITKGRWPVIGWASLEPALAKPIDFFMQDMYTGEFSIYKENGEIIPATRSEIEGLECEAAWEPEHIEDRLRDHYAGQKNIWLESLRPK
jgi:Immunity protein 26